jgi:hypothetical protein
MALKSSNKKKNVFVRIISIISLITFLVFLWWFVYGAIWKINNIEIVDAKHTDTEGLKNDIYNITQTKKFLIIPNNHILFLSKGQIERYILETYPSVEFVEVNKTKDRDVVISIKDRMAMGVWCDELCYFFDDEGTIFKKSFDYTGAVFTKWEIASSTPLNFYDKALCVDVCIDKTFVSFLTQNKVMKVIIEGEDLRMFTEYGYYIKSLNNATTTMRNVALFKVEYKESGGELEYVDVRFSDKIFYK